MIKNLLFDLGGVIMDIDRMRCVRAFQNLGFDTVGDYLTDYAQKGPFEALEEGRITAQEFRAELKRLMPEGVTDLAIDDAFQEFLTGIPVARLHELRELRRMGLGIYLLSNTNSIMWNGRILEEFRKEGLHRADYFDGMLPSFEAGVQKPDPRMFERARDLFGLVPSETLFIDDSQTNLDAASALGFKTLHVAPGKEFAELIGPFLK